MVNMTWLETSPNRHQIQKLLNKREQIVMDVVHNGKFIRNYQKKLRQITTEIEYLYFAGGVSN